MAKGNTEAKGEPALARFTPEAAQHAADAIAETGGQEVFFAGSLDEAGRVAELRVCARGNASATPALLEGLEVREVVIHNHPSGNLTPSEADLSLAALYSAHGHGVFIVDNAVRHVYVVVEPFLPREAERLDGHELHAQFLPGSSLARALPGFEARPQQTEMSRAVARAFNEDGVAVVEAPTGVGKTLAYLLPAALWSLRNRERVVVSTRTINLQEQIIQKDLPVLQRCLPDRVNACLVKGRGNYLCWRKLERALSEATLFDDADERSQLEGIAEWAENTEDGSREDLPFMPGRGLWEQVCSESDVCNMRRCPNQQRCFLGKARRDVAKADILVVNHHMLFSDLAIKLESGSMSAQAVLPAYERLILDEAHNIEDAATEYFGASATRLGALAALGRFSHTERGKERGLLPFLKHKLIKDCDQVSVADFEKIQEHMDTRLGPAIAAARELTITAFDQIRELAAAMCGQIGREIKWRLTQETLDDPALRALHAEYLLPAAEALGQAAEAAQSLHRRLRDAEPGAAGSESPIATEMQQLQAYTNRLQRLALTLAEAASPALAENTVRWIEVDSHNPKFVRVVRCPLEVREPLAESLYAKLKTIVMTSATLSVRQEFSYFFSRLGLDSVDPARASTLCLESPFDFERQALMCVATDLSPPDGRAFLDDTVEMLRAVFTITRGHAFVLFTSFHALDYAHQRLQADLRAAGVTALRQGEATRTQLLERFRREPSSVLFATDSFWEGVDVAGDALQCVVLPRLPFRVPTEPILEARTEAIDARGGNAFMEFSVPQAVIKFRQGFGRLIRRRSDRGVVLVLDQRVATRRYGRIFLESLPGVRTVTGPRAAVLRAIDAFFNGNQGE